MPLWKNINDWRLFKAKTKPPTNKRKLKVLLKLKRNNRQKEKTKILKRMIYLRWQKYKIYPMI